MKKTAMWLTGYVLFFIVVCGIQPALSAEPQMDDYTYYPAFITDAVAPNILVMLDNSGSMNFNAYGEYPGNGGTVNDSFAGEPYHTIDRRIEQTEDDCEENNVTGASYYNSADLDIGRDSDDAYPDQIIGLRFQNIKIPNSAEVVNAYIEFNTHAIYSLPSAINVLITGEDIDDAQAFGTTSKNISSRPATSAAVSWNIPHWNAVDEKHQTPNLASIIQEIVNRPGWSSGNALSLMIKNTGGLPSSGRMATAFDADPSKAALLHIEIANVNATKYYGLFNPDYFYKWNGSNRFVHAYKKVYYEGDPASGGYWKVTDLSGASHALTDAEIATGDLNTGLWDGNFLNWLCMRRIDVLRKVLMGGLVTSRQGGGNETAYGEDPVQTSRTFIRKFDSSAGSAVSPWDGTYYYGMKGGYIYVDDDSSPFSNEIEKIRISIQQDYRYEPEAFYKDESGTVQLGGVLQKFGNKARWGNEFFNTGTGRNQSGGTIVSTIGTNMTSLITDLQNTGCDTWTPLAEAYYVATQYFKQEDPESGLDYPNNAVPNSNNVQDPYYNGTEFVECASSFVLLLTDGASTKDSKIPVFLKDYDNDGDNIACNEAYGTNCDYSSGGTDFLDDVALYARTTDLRGDLDGDQNLVLYTVYALSDDDNARRLLKDASRNGGFEDRNGNNLPDGDYSDPPEDRLEWDKDGDNTPDTYFEASDGYKLEQELSKAISAILERAASGTAVSVISSATEGEGNLIQAYFRPKITTVSGDEVMWTGYLQSLWLDQKGFIREDTDQNRQLDENTDRIVKYIEQDGEIKIARYDVSGDPYPDLETVAPSDTVVMRDMLPIWEAGSLLAQRSAATRKIFTYIDKNMDGAVNELPYNGFDGNGEVIDFNTANAAVLKPYLGVQNSAEWGYLGETHDERVDNLINFIRGANSGFTGNAAIRDRTMDGRDWKLGDIVYSTPVLVSKPVENFDLLYGDESYHEFYKAMENRETAVYAGANDGMLHAFTSWKYNGDIKKFEKPAVSPPSENIGDELWAFIPQTLLPHLKWLADIDYTHVCYVDMKPKIFDAKILPDDAHYVDADADDNWGTILLAGLNFGGKHIWAKGDYDGDGTDETRHFYPSYICMDITDPRNPVLLWERTYSPHPAPAETAEVNDTDLGLTTSYPGVVKVNDKWFAVFGSGPIDFEGISDRPGHVFVVDLKTGEPYKNGANDWLFEGTNPRAFMADAASLDKNMNYNVDAIYIGETYNNNPGGLDWAGSMYKITVPFKCTAADCVYGDADDGGYVDDPLDAGDPWTVSKLFDSPAPITAAPVLSIDTKDNAWVFFGTGRYLSDADKTNIDQQYIFGIKDPFFNRNHDTLANYPSALYGDGYYHNTSAALTLDKTDLFDADPYIVLNGGAVYDGTSFFGNYNDLIAEARKKDGWYRNLTISGERNFTKPAIIGGTLLVSTFVPNDDICGAGGKSYLYGLFYETGTAFKRPTFSNGLESIVLDGDPKDKVKDVIDLGDGMASSPGIHIGRQEKDKATAYIQTSRGNVVDLDVDPALKTRSGLKSWIEKE